MIWIDSSISYLAAVLHVCNKQKINIYTQHSTAMYYESFTIVQLSTLTLCDPLPVSMVSMEMTYMYIYTSCTNEDHQEPMDGPLSTVPYISWPRDHCKLSHRGQGQSTQHTHTPYIFSAIGISYHPPHVSMATDVGL